MKRGDPLGLPGKEGGSGRWSHPHLEIKSRQPSGEWDAEEGFAFLWEAYPRDYKPDVMALARPRRYAKAGKEVTLDGGRSWVRDGKPAYRWNLPDGRIVNTSRVAIRYAKTGTYSEVLQVKDSQCRIAFDCATVNVYDEEDPITIYASYFSSLDVKTGQAITFKVRTFGLINGEETWDFAMARRGGQHNRMATPKSSPRTATPSSRTLTRNRVTIL